MTPTLVSTGNAAFHACPAPTSENSTTSAEASPLLGTGSDETSSDQGDDVVPSDFAVLLAAMMAPAALSPLRTRNEPSGNPTSPTPSTPKPAAEGLASASVGLSSAVVGAGSSVGLSSAVVGSSAGVGALGYDLAPSHVEGFAPLSTSTTNAVPAVSDATSVKLDPTPATAPVNPAGFVGSTPATAPPAVRTALIRADGADTSGIDPQTQSLASGAIIEQESSGQSFALVALDRPISLGRQTPRSSGQVSDASGTASPPVGTGELSPTVALRIASADSFASEQVPALSPPDELPTPVGAGAASVESVDVGMPTVVLGQSANATSVLPGTRGVAPRGDNAALDASSVDDDELPSFTEAEPDQATAASPARTNGVVAQDGIGSGLKERPGPSDQDSGGLSITGEDTATKDGAAAAPGSPVGVASGPGHPSPTDRAAVVDVPIATVVEAVRPSDASQHIVRAAQRTLGVDGTQHIRLEMHPGDLGAVAVEVTIEGGTVHVAMIAERGETKDLLRSSVGELRSSLVAAGFAAGRVDIQSGLSENRFGQQAERHDAWSQSFDRPDSRRDQPGAFANQFGQTGSGGDQSRGSRQFAAAHDLRSTVSAGRNSGDSDRLLRTSSTTPDRGRHDRLDVQL